jgi:hypothetical protein
MILKIDISDFWLLLVWIYEGPFFAFLLPTMPPQGHHKMA